ncbi:MAG: hypothetical protein M1595_00470 [Candidatus Thermoplasmatota archaeon]|nr:hypothetical protein [Candidatus Thermoplasmatota archaeon]
MTSFRNRIRQRIIKERKRITKKEIEDKVRKDWEIYREIEGIKKWLAEHPDLAEDLRTKRAKLVRDRIKRDINGK